MKAVPLPVLLRRYRAEVETLKRRIRRGLASERDKERLAVAHRRLMYLEEKLKGGGRGRREHIRVREGL